MIGFLLPYRNQLDTYVTLRIAQFVDDLGLGCSIVSDSHRQQTVHPRFDRKVMSYNSTNVREWIKSLQFLVVSGAYRAKPINWALEANIPIFLIVDWDRPFDEYRPVADVANLVVCSSWNMTQVLRDRWRINHIRYVPWDCGIPPVRRVDESCNGHMLLPICHRKPYITVANTLEMADRLLASLPNTVITLTHRKSLPRQSLRKIAESIQVWDGRLKLVRTENWGHLLALLTRHDVLLKLDLGGNLSSSLLTTAALTMGTPVISFDSYYANELIRDGRNGLLVQTGTVIREGVPEVIPDLEAFEVAVWKTCKQKNTLRKLRRNSDYQLEDRAKLFRQGWREILGVR